MIVDGDVGEAKALRNHRMLALQRQIKHYALGLAETGQREKAGQQNKQTSSVHGGTPLLL
jgi:hypothetical protein